MISTVSFNYNNRISFGSVERTVYDDKSDVIYRNNSYIFRSDLNWENVIDNITKDRKQRKIYCYACSDGSEPYSIAMGIIAKLGYKNAQKYFPIIARDVDETMIKSAKSGVINLSLKDFKKIREYEERANINFIKGLKKNNYSSQKNSANYDEFELSGIVSDDLRHCVDFGVGDICVDSYDFDYNDSVIFFRNALPYLPKEKRDMLLATFARNLTDSTAIVIGQYDKQILGMLPLLNVQNHTFGLNESSNFYFQGTRLRDMPTLRLSSRGHDESEYFKYLARLWWENSKNNSIKKMKCENKLYKSYVKSCYKFNKPQKRY